MVSKKSKLFNARAELATLFRQHHFFLKEQLTSYDYCSLGIQLLLSWRKKWTNGPYYSEENNSQLLFPRTRFKLSSGNGKFIKTCIHWSEFNTSRCLMRWVVLTLTMAGFFGLGFLFWFFGFLQLCHPFRVQDFPEWLEVRESPAGLEEKILWGGPWVWKRHRATKGDSL